MPTGWMKALKIKLRNHKKEPMEIRVVEHLYRWSNWDISKNSDPFNKLDSKTVRSGSRCRRMGKKW